jgi:GntR family transcriptional regulator
MVVSPDSPPVDRGAPTCGPELTKKQTRYAQPVTDPTHRLAELRAAERRNQVRRLRDILRSNLFNHRYPAARLPSEAELMAGHGVTRGVVRDALDLLRDEGIIDRLQGYGTYTLQLPQVGDLVNFRGLEHVPQSGVWDAFARTTLLSRRVVDTPDAVHAIMPDTGGRCLEFEYSVHSDSETLAVSTHYFRYPEAEVIATGKLGSNFWEFLHRSGLRVGQAKTTISAALVDTNYAEILGTAVKAPLITLDQVLFTMDAEVFDVAFIRLRGDRLQIGMSSSDPEYPRA